ncbi:hypothetical protein LUX32_39320 [Actinomadura madurae]|nr:hypothetical protein [Actinomadura madurae]MCP9983006.1 hypothetical protein [Actinomadura madurae]
MDLAEVLELFEGQGGVHQGDRLLLLVGQVRGQVGGEGVDQVGDWSGARVDGLDDGIDGGVLRLHRLQQGQVVGTVCERLGQHRPERLVLRGVVGVQGRLEQLPARGGGQDAPGVVAHAGGGLREALQFPPQRIVHGVHRGPLVIAHVSSLFTALTEQEEET